jgi:hypothetical protein
MRVAPETIALAPVLMCLPRFSIVPGIIILLAPHSGRSGLTYVYCNPRQSTCSSISLLLKLTVIWVGGRLGAGFGRRSRARSLKPGFRCSVTGYQPGLQNPVVDRVVNDPFDQTGVPHG